MDATDDFTRDFSPASDSTGSCIIVGGSPAVKDSSTRPTSFTSSTASTSQQPESSDAPNGPSLTRLNSYNDQRRDISGATLVSNKSTHSRLKRGIDALDVKSDAATGGAKKSDEDKRRSGRLAVAIASTASTLGKRSREVLDNGKKRLKAFKSTKRKSLRARNADGSAVVETKEEEQLEPPRKRTRLADTKAAEAQESEKKQSVPVPRAAKKKWLSAGLYVGQQNDFDARLSESKNKLKNASNPGQSKQRTMLPLPMFAGARILERGRPFKLPFDVFSPLPPGQPKPEEWRKTQSNRFTGDAAGEWKKNAPLPPSRCICAPDGGCDEDCLNRFMLYECDENNCNIGAQHCTNRSFADLKERVKSGKKYHIGVEVLKTPQKGFGVRACRTFEPHQIIVEYAGEIITQEECERRMNDEYKNAECYYLMNFDQNMIIDATRGSIARFVNHSCEPNCKMVKWIVAGKPRMALFAGAKGVMTGDELTYDYCQTENFLWGKECRCGMPSCRGTLGPKDDKRQKGQTAGSNEAVAVSKRKLQQAFQGLDSGRKSKGTVLKKKRRLNVPSKPKRTISSSTGSTTLVDKENVPQGATRNTKPQSTKTSRSLSNKFRKPVSGRRGVGILRVRGSNSPLTKSTKEIKVKTRTTTVTSVRNASANAKRYLVKSIKGSTRKTTTTRIAPSVRVVVEE